MKGPRYYTGLAGTMIFWGIMTLARCGLQASAWLMDWEKEYQEIRDEVDVMHKAQKAAAPGRCALCGGVR